MSMEHEFHRELKLVVASRWRERSIAVFTEFKLLNGCVADVIALTQDNQIHIIEIKTTLKASFANNIIRKYRGYAHKLFIAAPDAEITRDTQQLFNNSLYYSLTDLGFIKVEGTIAYISKDCRADAMNMEIFKHMQRQLLQVL